MVVWREKNDLLAGQKAPDCSCASHLKWRQWFLCIGKIYCDHEACFKPLDSAFQLPASGEKKKSGVASDMFPIRSWCKRGWRRPQNTISSSEFIMFSRSPRTALAIGRLLSATVPRSPALRIKAMSSGAPKRSLVASVQTNEAYARKLPE